MRNVSGYYAESPDSTWIRHRFFWRFFFVLPPWGDHFWGIDREDASSEAFLSTSEFRWKGWSPWRFLRASTETKSLYVYVFPTEWQRLRLHDAPYFSDECILGWWTRTTLLILKGHGPSQCPQSQENVFSCVWPSMEATRNINNHWLGFVIPIFLVSFVVPSMVACLVDWDYSHPLFANSLGSMPWSCPCRSSLVQSSNFSFHFVPHRCDVAGDPWRITGLWLWIDWCPQELESHWYPCDWGWFLVQQFHKVLSFPSNPILGYPVAPEIAVSFRVWMLGHAPNMHCEVSFPGDSPQGWRAHRHMLGTFGCLVGMSLLVICLWICVRLELAVLYFLVCPIKLDWIWGPFVSS